MAERVATLLNWAILEELFKKIGIIFISVKLLYYLCEVEAGMKQMKEYDNTEFV